MKRRNSLLLITCITLIAICSSSYYVRSSDNSWITGTFKVVMFTSPDSSYQVIVNCINEAQHDIKIELYSFTNPYLMDCLINAIQRGVHVTLILEKKHFTWSENEYTLYIAYRLNMSGAAVYFASHVEYPLLHAKFMIIDFEIVVVESANWVKSGVPVDPSYGNREWGIVIYSREVASRFTEIFNYDLSIATPYSPSQGVGEEPSRSIPTGSYEHPFTSVETTCQMKVLPFFSPEDSESVLKYVLRKANESIYIEQPYIELSWDNRLNPLVAELQKAVERGVDVKVILGVRNSMNEETFGYLQGIGVDVVYMNLTSIRFLHNKGIIIDSKIVVVTSVNWSDEGVRENREAGVVIVSKNVATFYESVFKYDWKISKGEPIEEKNFDLTVKCIARGTNSPIEKCLVKLLKDGQVLSEKVTNGEGLAVFYNLSMGMYSIEVYYLNYMVASEQVQLDKDIIVEVTCEVYLLTVRVVYENETPVSGFAISIKDQYGNTLCTVETDESGEILLMLPAGEYIIVVGNYTSQIYLCENTVKEYVLHLESEYAGEHEGTSLIEEKMREYAPLVLLLSIAVAVYILIRRR